MQGISKQATVVAVEEVVDLMTQIKKVLTIQTVVLAVVAVLVNLLEKVVQVVVQCILVNQDQKEELLLVEMVENQVDIRDLLRKEKVMKDKVVRVEMVVA
jgi:hypothetical protein